MSAKISGDVWELMLKDNQRMVLLAMADHADHQGNNVFPSIELIAWKVDKSTRQVQRIIRSLIKSNLLVEQQRPGKTTVYSIKIENGIRKEPFRKGAASKAQAVATTPDTTVSPPEPSVAGVTPDTQMSPHPRHPDVTPTPDTQMSPEPSFKPSGNQESPPPPEKTPPSEPEQDSTDSSSGDDGAEENKSLKKPEPKPRKRNLVFDAISEHIFNVETDALSKGEGKRIGKVVKELKDAWPDMPPGVLATHVAHFVEYWKAEKAGASVPRGEGTLLLHFREWHDSVHESNIAKPDPNAPPAGQRWEYRETEDGMEKFAVPIEAILETN